MTETWSKILRDAGIVARSLGVAIPVKILLVDDSNDYRKMFPAMLRRIPGTTYEVEAVATVEQAISIIKERRHDLYMIDENLGIESGIGMVMKLQEEGHHFPFIIVTSGDQSHRSALGADCMDYVDKCACASPGELHRCVDFAIKNWKTRDSGPMAA